MNPDQRASLQFSEGSVPGRAGKRVPSYSDPVVVQAQVQDLTQVEMMHLDALNIQNSQKSIYFFGEVAAIVRVNAQGGDLITLEDGRIYLTTKVFEQWPDWCKVAATLQNQLSDAAQEP